LFATHPEEGGEKDLIAVVLAGITAPELFDATRRRVTIVIGSIVVG